MEVYSLTILEAIIPKSRCRQGCASSEASRRESFLVSFSFWWIQVFLGMGLRKSSLCLGFHMAFSSVPVSSLLSLIKTLPLDLGPTRIIQNHLLISQSLSSSVKTLFPNKVTFKLLSYKVIFTSSGD